MTSKSFTPFSLFLIYLLTSSLLISPTTPKRPRTQRKTASWNNNSLTLFGDAAIKNGSVVLTSSPNCSHGYGRALYSQPIRFLEPTTCAPASFSAQFAFSISPSLSFGDGLAFIITSDPQSFSSAKGYMGIVYGDKIRGGGCEGKESATIAVELDTSFDAELEDINDNHVGIDVCSIVSMASADSGKVGVDLKGGIPMTAWVDYTSSDKAMKVWLSYSNSLPHNPLLNASIDLSPMFHETMYVGFSASNGPECSGSLHIIHKWSFRTFRFISAGSTGNCPAHNATDSKVNPPNQRRNEAMFFLTLFGLLAFLLFLVIVVAVWIFKKSENVIESSNSNEECSVPRMSFEEIKTATKDFHCSKIIGEGSSGTMYLGQQQSGNKVAIKRFNRADIFTNTLSTELATVLGNSPHPNLVPLKAWCCEKNELLLVYEYMPNGNLEKYLHHSSPSSLSWLKRFNIVLDIASALSFLHRKCEKKIVHGDVRTSKILLDAEFTVKLGDFGVRTGPRVMDSMRNTVYLAPEYAHSGVPTEKSDVYSFGVVALELATGKTAVERGVVLVDWVWRLWGRGKLIEAADPRLAGMFSRDEMGRVLVIGLCCAHPDSKQRPNMGKVIRMLKGEAPLIVLPATKPAVRIVSEFPEESSDVGGFRVSEDPGAVWQTPCNSFNQGV